MSLNDEPGTQLGDRPSIDHPYLSRASDSIAPGIAVNEIVDGEVMGRQTKGSEVDLGGTMGRLTGPINPFGTS